MKKKETLNQNASTRHTTTSDGLPTTVITSTDPQHAERALTEDFGPGEASPRDLEMLMLSLQLHIRAGKMIGTVRRTR